jgi:hypothetical protein
MASVSFLSPRGVEVPWALTYCTWSALTPAFFSALTMLRRGPSVSGAVMWKASPLMPKPASSA